MFVNLVLNCSSSLDTVPEKLEPPDDSCGIEHAYFDSNKGILYTRDKMRTPLHPCPRILYNLTSEIAKILKKGGRMDKPSGRCNKADLITAHFYSNVGLIRF